MPIAEEADETEYWLEFFAGLEHASNPRLAKFQNDAHQITSMIIASIKMARKKQ